MRQDQAATLLRAYGFDVRTDGLGNVAARVCVKRSDGTIGFEWRPVPADSSADVMRLYAANRGSRPLIRAGCGVCQLTPQCSSSRSR